MHRPNEVRCNVDAREVDAVHLLRLFSMHEERRAFALPDLLKSTMTSLVLLVFRSRLLSKPRFVRCSFSSREWVSSLSYMMRPDDTVVSSANFVTVFVGWMAEQPCVNRMKRAGLSTQPCGVPVLRTKVDYVQPPILTTRGLL